MNQKSDKRDDVRERGSPGRGWVAGSVALVPLIGVSVLAGCVRSRPPVRTAGGRMHPCQERLTMIDGAKEQWALEHGAAPGAVMEWSDLVGENGYLKNKPVCPAGFEYAINPRGTDPACPSGLPGHSLSEVGLAIATTDP